MNNRDRETEHTAFRLMDETIAVISKAIIEINQKKETLKYYYEKLDWDTDVAFEIEEGLQKLGLSLAILEQDKTIDLEEDNNQNT